MTRTIDFYKLGITFAVMNCCGRFQQMSSDMGSIPIYST